MVVIIVLLVLLALIVGVGALLEGLLWMLLIGLALLVVAAAFGWSRFKQAARSR